MRAARGKLTVIEGRVTGARPGQQIVLFARSGAWYVQPFTDQPFTKFNRIRPGETQPILERSMPLCWFGHGIVRRPGWMLPNKGGEVIAVAVAPGEVRTACAGILANLVVPALERTGLFICPAGLSPSPAPPIDSPTQCADLTRGSKSGCASRRIYTTHCCRVFSALPCNSTSRLSNCLKIHWQATAEPGSAIDGTSHRRRPKHASWATLNYDRSLDLEQAFSRIPQDFAGHNGMARLSFVSW